MSNWPTIFRLGLNYVRFFGIMAVCSDPIGQKAMLTRPFFPVQPVLGLCAGYVARHGDSRVLGFIMALCIML
jgi:hypothetical protein